MVNNKNKIQRGRPMAGKSGGATKPQITSTCQKVYENHRGLSHIWVVIEKNNVHPETGVGKKTMTANGDGVAQAKVLPRESATKARRAGWLSHGV